MSCALRSDLLKSQKGSGACLGLELGARLETVPERAPLCGAVISLAEFIVILHLIHRRCAHQVCLRNTVLHVKRPVAQETHSSKNQ